MTAKIIAIDGPSASGKGTVASRVAAALGWDYLDSGALYRLTALYARQKQTEWTDEEGVARLAAELPVGFVGQTVLLDSTDVSQEIRSEAVGMGASAVAQLPAVRAALLQRQRDFQTAKRLVGRRAGHGFGRLSRCGFEGVSDRLCGNQGAAACQTARPALQRRGFR